jgi:ubiquinol-cytochrome c reductase iron-sulfur subunit
MNVIGWLIAALLWLRGAKGKRRPPAPPDVSKVEIPHDLRAERLVAALLIATGVLGVAFFVLFIVDDNTQLLGLALGLALACLAIACVVAAKRLVPQETAVEERPELLHEDDVEEVDELVQRGGTALSRRGLLAGAAGIAGAGLGAAIIVPATALGPNAGDAIYETPWRAGRRLVDEQGKPVRASDIADGEFVTAFPEHGDVRELGSPVVVVRLPPAELHPPRGREDWSPQGISAYSKICTHAGCAISEYRNPLYEPTSEGPALICPCHYSTFDVRHAAKVTFGPAGRPLPQLPLRIGPDGVLQAAGGFSGTIGPAWWGTKTS